MSTPKRYGARLPESCARRHERLWSIAPDVQDHDEIWLLDLDDSSTRALTENAFSSTEPSFNHDGTKVVFQWSGRVFLEAHPGRTAIYRLPL